MPFTDQGLWEEETFHQPGGGAAAGLDIMNATNSYQNYKRAREAGVLATMLKMRQEGDVGHDVAMTPEGGQALGTLDISPDSIDQMWQNTPEQKFQRGVAAIPDEQRTNEAVQDAALTAGIPYKDWGNLENKFEGTAVRENKRRDTRKKELATALQNALKTNISISDTLDEAVDRTAAQIRSQGLDKDEEAQVAAWEQSTKPGTMIGGQEGAKVEHIEAGTEVSRAKAKAILDTLPARINLLNAHTVLANAQAARQRVMAAHADGTAKLSAKDCLSYSAKMEALATQADKAASEALPGRGTRAQNAADGYRKEAAEWKKKATELNTAPVKPATTPPKGKAAAAAPAGAPKLGKLLGKATGRPDGPDMLKDGTKVIIQNGQAYAAP